MNIIPFLVWGYQLWYLNKQINSKLIGVFALPVARSTNFIFSHGWIWLWLFIITKDQKSRDKINGLWFLSLISVAYRISQCIKYYSNDFESQTGLIDHFYHICTMQNGENAKYCWLSTEHMKRTRKEYWLLDKNYLLLFKWLPYPVFSSGWRYLLWRLSQTIKHLKPTFIHYFSSFNVELWWMGAILAKFLFIILIFFYGVCSRALICFAFFFFWEIPWR